MKDFRIAINFTTSKGETTTDSSIKCPEKASPEFYLAMHSLQPTVKEICELPKTSKVEILGITYTYIGDDKVMGAKIHFKLKLISDEFIDITTPFRYAASVTESITDSQLMKGKLEETFVKITEEANLYINGKREQVDHKIDKKGDEE